MKLAKSLHTVTVVSRLAKHVHAENPKSRKDPVAIALAILGYGPDDVSDELMAKIIAASAA